MTNETYEEPLTFKSWSILDDAVGEVRRIQKELGRFPSGKDLRDIGRNTLHVAIYRFHGGMSAMRDRCGVPQTTVARGHWNEFDNVRAAVEAWIREHGTFPTAPALTRAGRHDLACGISKFHGGFIAVRERMGIAPTSDVARKGEWTSRDRVVAALNELTAQLGHFPVQKEILALGSAGMYRAIYRWHGGYSKLREEMGFPGPRRPLGYFDEFDRLARDLGEIAERIGHFPIQDELDAMRQSSLYYGIKRHGGIATVRERMGYGPVTDETIAAHADALARIVPALGTDTEILWPRIKRAWTAHDLNAAIDAYVATDTLDAFRKLLDAPAIPSKD